MSTQRRKMIISDGVEYRELTTTQKGFYVNRNTFRSVTWNLGFFVSFKRHYTYDHINDALNAFLLNQDGIRQRVTEIDGRPYLYIEPYSHHKYPYYSFEDYSQYQTFEREQLATPFDLDEDLYRGLIVDIAGVSGVLLPAHHIITDGYSSLALLNFVHHVERGEPLFNRSCLDHIDRELQYPSTRRFQSDKAYWLDAFSRVGRRLIVSGETYEPDYSAEIYNAAIDTSVADRIRRYCRDHAVTFANFYYTLFGVYFKSLVGDDAFCVGIPVMNRISERDLETLGLYLHVCPLIYELNGEKTFADNARMIADKTMEMFRHNGFVAGDLAAAMGDNRKIFDVVLDYFNTISDPDYEFGFVYSDRNAVPLEIHIGDEIGAGVNIKYRYRTCYSTREKIEAMHYGILSLIDEILSDDTVHIDSMIGSRELSVLQGEKSELTDHDIFGTFARAAETNWERVCLTTAEGSITYGDFYKRVCLLARRLADEGVAVGDRVAVLARRRIDTYAAIYAVFAVGGVYVPIDPDHPISRIRFVLSDSNARVAFVPSDKEEISDAISDIVKIIYPCEVLAKETYNGDFEFAGKNVEDAYMIYTSGTTGAPKGALNTMRGLFNRIRWMQSRYPVREGDVVLQKTPFTFDVSVWEILWWGLYGAACYAPEDGDHYSIAKIIEAIYDGKVTHLHFVPSVYRIFVDYLYENRDQLYKLSSLRHIILSGEALDGNVVRRMQSLLPTVRQHNLYGPAECAIDVSFFDCDGEVPADVPIGRPIDNVILYVCDSSLRILPRGERGELVIAGDAVGKGYPSMPDVTADRFVCDSSFEGVVYRTGDVVYVDGNGYLRFCGRLDSQVKINGQRIEPEEIEMATLSIDGVQEAAAVVVGAQDAKRIIVYYVGREFADGELISMLLRKLPRGMVPAKCVRLDALPLGAHGKVDKSALSLLADSLSTVYQPPLNEPERVFCDMFAERLGVERYGRDQHFLESGATSLDVISVLCNDIFRGMTPDVFVSLATPERLAAYLLGDRTAVKGLLPLYISEREGMVFVLFPYAGGNAATVYPLMRAIRAQREDVSFYYCGWETDLAESRRDIVRLAQKSKIYFYAHCAGNALALETLSDPEVASVVETIYSGGSILIDRKRPVINTWRLAPDFVLKRILTKAGLKVEGVDKSAFDEVLQRFRQNVARYYETLARLNAKAECRAALILGSNDIFTQKMRFALRRWSQFVTDAENIATIDTDTHYYNVAESRRLADIILEDIRKEKT